MASREAGTGGSGCHRSPVEVPRACQEACVPEIPAPVSPEPLEGAMVRQRTRSHHARRAIEQRERQEELEGVQPMRLQGKCAACDHFHRWPDMRRACSCGAIVCVGRAKAHLGPGHELEEPEGGED